jgi:uncharacterized membrane protein (DUF485 family)
MKSRIEKAIWFALIYFGFPLIALAAQRLTEINPVVAGVIWGILIIIWAFVSYVLTMAIDFFVQKTRGK